MDKTLAEQTRIPQVDITSLENRRGNAIRSAFLSIMAQGISAFPSAITAQASGTPSQLPSGNG